MNRSHYDMMNRNILYSSDCHYGSEYEHMSVDISCTRYLIHTTYTLYHPYALYL